MKIKLLVLFVFILSLTSCFNANKIDINQIQVESVSVHNFSTIKVELINNIDNRNKKIKIKDFRLDIMIGDVQNAVITSSADIIIPKGCGDVILPLYINIKGGLLGAKSLLDNIETTDKKITATGYVKFKYGIISKKIKIDNLPIIDIINNLDFMGGSTAFKLF